MSEIIKMPNKNCYDAVQKVATDNGFSNYELDVVAGSAKGDNYMGYIFRVIVKNDRNTLNLVVKCAPTCDVHALVKVPTSNIYNKEIFAYKEVLKMLKELQDREFPSPAIKFDFVRCYLASEKLTEELLIFEDLNIDGFKMLGRKNTVTYAHAKLVIASLASLHALSFVLKKRNPGDFINLTLKCLKFNDGLQSFVAFFGASIDLAAKEIKERLYKEKICQLRQTYEIDMEKAFTPDEYSVLCHGDCWINNVLFKYQENTPVDVRLIDYQVMRYGPPTLDILQFLFTSTDGEFRATHYKECLDYYHDTLAKALKEYSLDIEEVFSKEVYKNQLKMISRYGAVIGIISAKVLVANDDEIMDASELANSEVLAAPTGPAYDNYLKKISDIVADCIEYGYL